MTEDKSGRKGDWIQTYTGRAYWPVDPRPAEVDIADIAHALSNVCRYGGHSRRFYSVAEHSIHVSNHVPAHCALAGLLHDATEAYIADIVRPMKPHLTNYREIEELNWQAIAARFNVHPKLPLEVHMADAGMLFVEQKVLLGPPPFPGWGMGLEKEAKEIEQEIYCYTPEVAKNEFIKRFNTLYYGLGYGTQSHGVGRPAYLGR